MSMCLYLKHASEIDLARYVRDGVDEDDLGMPGEDLGAMSAISAMTSVGIPGLQEMARWLEDRKQSVPNDPMLAQMEMARQHVAAQLANLGYFPPGGGAAAEKPAGGSKTPVLDLHKSWHVLHYLFTGQAWDGDMPASALLLGGKEVGEDMGYGPARILTPQETASFAGFLQALDVDKLAARLDADQMQRLEIYSASDDEAELEEELEHYFPQLQAFVADAAAKRQGLLIYMM